MGALAFEKVQSSAYHGPASKPVVLHNGFFADTHEVAAAKQAHLDTLAQLSQGHGDSYGGDYRYGYSHGDKHLRYHVPIVIPHVLKDGHIADTHGVAAAKAEHYAAVAKTNTHGDYGNEEQSYSGSYGDEEHHNHAVPYHEPLAKLHVLKSGYLADTCEVAAAKEHHLHALHSNNHGH